MTITINLCDSEQSVLYIGMGRWMDGWMDAKNDVGMAFSWGGGGFSGLWPDNRDGQLGLLANILQT